MSKAAGLGDHIFVDADEIGGLCEWREFKTGKVLGLVTEYKETVEDNWYAKYGWYWKPDVLEAFLKKHPDAVVCGSSENIVDFYKLFDKIYILKKTNDELTANLDSPNRENPFGNTPEQRKGFMGWQDYLIREASKFNPIIVEGNDITNIYERIRADLI